MSNYSVILAGAVIAATFTASIPAKAASDADLYAARDRFYGSQCSIKSGSGAGFTVARHKMGPAAKGRTARYNAVYEIPCETSARNIYSVLLGEDGMGLHPIHLPVPIYSLKRIEVRGRLVTKATINGFKARSVFSGLHVDARSGTLTTSYRLSPGTGDGHLVETYRLSDGSLSGAWLDMTGKKAVPVPVVWKLRE
ncbi:MAG: hypothetical protein KDJ29_14765 [Hyphomicrobiales bacterium]|nr:hypothetical protein [Hyphomicrobiales bacterium]